MSNFIQDCIPDNASPDRKYEMAFVRSGRSIRMSNLSPVAIEKMSNSQIEQLALDFVDAILEKFEGKDPRKIIVIVQLEDSSARALNMGYCLKDGKPVDSDLVSILFSVEAPIILMNQHGYSLNAFASLHPQLLAQIVWQLISKKVNTRVVFDWILDGFKDKLPSISLDYLKPMKYMSALYVLLDEKRDNDPDAFKCFKAVLASIAQIGTINEDTRRYLIEQCQSDDPNLAAEARETLENLQAESGAVGPSTTAQNSLEVTRAISGLAPGVPPILPFSKAPSALDATKFLAGPGNHEA